MTHLPTSAHGHARGRGTAHVMLVAAALIACGLGATPAGAGTVLRGQVVVPAKRTPAEARPSAEAVRLSDVVVYVTENPGAGKPRLPGRGVRTEIELRGDRFDPPVLAVTARSKVRYRNRDRVYHSLFSVSPDGRSELGDLAPGQRREVRFDRPGVNSLFCQLHPAAAAFVIVCPNWFHTRASRAGVYVLPPLPAGRYVVHAWHPRLGETTRPVEVTGRDVVRLDLRL